MMIKTRSQFLTEVGSSSSLLGLMLHYFDGSFANDQKLQEMLLTLDEAGRVIADDRFLDGCSCQPVRTTSGIMAMSSGCERHRQMPTFFIPIKDNYDARLQRMRDALHPPKIMHVDGFAIGQAGEDLKAGEPVRIATSGQIHKVQMPPLMTDEAELRRPLTGAEMSKLADQPDVRRSMQEAKDRFEKEEAIRRAGLWPLAWLYKCEVCDIVFHRERKPFEACFEPERDSALEKFLDLFQSLLLGVKISRHELNGKAPLDKVFHHCRAHQFGVGVLVGFDYADRSNY